MEIPAIAHIYCVGIYRIAELLTESQCIEYTHTLKGVKSQNMAVLRVVFLLFLMVIHQATSQTCPDGTPAGCSCQNFIFNCSRAGLDAVPPISTTAGFSTVDFSFNSLQTIPERAFDSLPTVKNIILNNNQITDISPGAFSNLHNLSVIDLEQNSLTSVDQTAFNILPGLLNLLLGDNGLVCDSGLDWLRDWIYSGAHSVTGTCTTGASLTDYLDGVTGQPTVLTFERSEYSFGEGDGMVSLVVERRGMYGIVQFDVSFSNGSALSPSDFQPVDSSSVTMLETQTRVPINIRITDNDEIEADKTFTVSISITQRGEVNVAIVGDPYSTAVTIIDNDAVPPVVTTPAPVPETTPTTAVEKMATTKLVTEKPVNTTVIIKATPEVLSKGVNVAAIVVPIVVVIIIICTVVSFYYYRKRKEDAKKGTTAGVRYAAVIGNQNRGKVYSDVTTKA